jgi:hypothetical protein
MSRTVENVGVRILNSLVATGVLALCIASCQSTSSSTSAQMSYESPQAAVQELVGALRANDEARIGKLLGPEGWRLVNSGDAVADQRVIAAFLAEFDKHHEVVVDGGVATLVVGEGDWPMPIPIVSEAGAWRFDTEQGREEILARRIGDNELGAIAVCRAIADAQHDFAEMNANSAGELRIYAQKFASSKGARDGLYWEAAAGEPQSPLGPLVAEAVEDGYGSPTRERRPFYGYYYRMLTEQGPSAPGGARSYVEGGRMTHGFAAIAWPSAYDVSGVMTFMINDQGVLYQRDLGADTARIAATMAAFDPGEGWIVVAD